MTSLLWPLTWIQSDWSCQCYKWRHDVDLWHRFKVDQATVQVIWVWRSTCQEVVCKSDELACLVNVNRINVSIIQHNSVIVAEDEIILTLLHLSHQSPRCKSPTSTATPTHYAGLAVSNFQHRFHTMSAVWNLESSQKISSSDLNWPF